MRGGSRPGAGRPRGATTRLSPEVTRATLEPLRLPGESWAAFGRRVGVPARQSIGRALARGATLVQLSAWSRAAGADAIDDPTPSW